MIKLVNKISILLLFSVLTCPLIAGAGTVNGKNLPNDGRLAIFSYHTKDYVEATYRTGGKYDPEAIKAIEYAMRSRGDDKTHEIDIGIIELMDHLQDHFGAETVELISGYRSPGYNELLRVSGRGAASESLHTKGKAVDIHLDEVGEEELYGYVKKLGVGGAGLYPCYAFVHADVGPRRTWEEARPEKRVLVGTDNNPNAAWTALTDRNAYRPGDTVSVTVTNNDYNKLKFAKNVWCERFRKGEWRERENLIKEKKSVTLDVGETLDYSWKTSSDQGLGKYRLVFFTSKDFNIPPVYSNEFYIRMK
jgi:uncharacterized protein YcbK (DUF882 family)